MNEISLQFIPYLYMYTGRCFNAFEKYDGVIMINTKEERLNVRYLQMEFYLFFILECARVQKNNQITLKRIQLQLSESTRCMHSFDLKKMEQPPDEM
jgi:hypothetical protein